LHDEYIASGQITMDDALRDQEEHAVDNLHRENQAIFVG
jgi:hypothetical protein